VQQLSQVERVEFFTLAGPHTLRLGIAGQPVNLNLLPASLQRHDLRRDRQAAAVLERTQPGHPMDPQAQAEADLVYGISLAIEGKPGEARRAFEAALELDPRSPRIRRALIALAAQQGQREEALRHIDAYLQGTGNEVDHELLRELGATLRGEVRCGG
jgi:Flp pilus assembly protein TadD